MQIRKMVKADAEAYRELRLKALQTNPEAFGSSYVESVKQPLEFFRNRISEPDSDNVIYVAEEDDKLIGMIGFLRYERIKMKHRADIWGVYVDVPARGKGVARQLMQHIIDHARQIKGLRQILLGVVTSNTRALRLYESFGFVIWGTEPESIYVNGVYYDEHYMHLSLVDDEFLLSTTK